MKKLVVALLLLGLSQAVYTQETTLQKEIRELLDLTGSGNLGLQVFSQMTEYFKQSYPEVPESFWEEMKKEIKVEELTNMVIPIYEKYFTEEEIKELLAFYQTPIGKKAIQVLPMVTTDSMKAGQEWGQKLAQRVIEKLEKNRN